LQKHVEYFPIDVSNILKDSSKKLRDDYENLRVTGIIDSYESGLEFIKSYDDKNNLIVFLGSSFGNFSYENGLTFLQKINSSMKKGDLFLIGLDLVKDKTVLERAYNDSQDITAKFNLNVLSRINSELDSNFNIRKFAHHVIYNENQNRVEIYLRSLENQTVNISKANLTLEIKQDELIHTENSCKYTIPKIKEILLTTDFQIRDIWYDKMKHYCLVLFSKND
jgi:dimethylhistidine N-methyltransferase